jgi:hypothetical protein
VELDVPQPIVLGAGEGVAVEVGGAEVTFKAAGEMSDSFSLTESRIPAGFEQYSREVAAAPDQMAEIIARHDFNPA